MNLPASLRSRLATAVLGAMGVSVATSANAETVATVPVGAVTVTANPAPSTNSPRYTALAFPLLNPPAASGRVSAVSSTSITIDHTPSPINSTNPYFIRITSGANTGLSILVNSNNGATLNLDTSRTGPISSLSTPIATGVNGDSYALYPADTLNSLFGDTTNGALTPQSADQIWIWQPAAGTYAKYYFNSAAGQWRDVEFDDDSSHVTILPETGVMYVRRATTPLNLVVTGVVPDTNNKIFIRNSGYTLVASTFPAPTTISSLSLHTNSNWAKTASFSTSDQLWIWDPPSGSYAKYFFNSNTSQWEDSEFGDPAGSTQINPQTPIMIKRAAAGQLSYTPYTLIKPYSL